jgi:ribosomal protein S18 acetylase RimI-like enzyme
LEAVLEVTQYIKTPSQVAGLRRLCATWQRDGGFWSFDELLPILSRPGSLVFFVGGTVEPEWDAALLVDVGPYEADVLYIYVRTDRRRDHLAEKLFAGLICHLKSLPQIEAIFLEVRMSNIAAIGLYEKLGMRRQSVRKKYYSNGEDALVFKLAIDRQSQ